MKVHAKLSKRVKRTTKKLKNTNTLNLPFNGDMKTQSKN
jgi:hypothetical protein